MNKLGIFLGIILVEFTTLVVAGYHFFGIAGALGGLVLFVLSIKALFKVVTNRLVGFGKLLFEKKSMVLRNAEVRLHGMSSAPEVDSEEGAGVKRTGETKFYYLDVTITPTFAMADAPFVMWDSSELLLVPFDAKAPTFEEPEPESEEQNAKPCTIHNVSVLEGTEGTEGKSEGESEGEEAGKAAGAQRLKLHVELPKEIDRVKFQYYFETFGDLPVPR